MGSAAEGSAEIRARVLAARERQHERFSEEGERTKGSAKAASRRVFANSQMSTQQIRTYCELSSDAERLLERAMQQQGLSARAHDRILEGGADDCRSGWGGDDRGQAYCGGDSVPDAGPELLGLKLIDLTGVRKILFLEYLINRFPK